MTKHTPLSWVITIKEWFHKSKLWQLTLTQQNIGPLSLWWMTINKRNTRCSWRRFVLWIKCQAKIASFRKKQAAKMHLLSLTKASSLLFQSQGRAWLSDRWSFIRMWLRLRHVLKIVLKIKWTTTSQKQMKMKICWILISIRLLIPLGRWTSRMRSHQGWMMVSAKERIHLNMLVSNSMSKFLMD